MGNLQSISDITRLVQDVQYTAALRGMSEPEKQKYFDTQKNELMNSLLDEREGTFQKTYADATRNNAIQNSLLFYLQRNYDLKGMGDSFKNNNERAINVNVYNKDLAGRQNEINEWSYNNKLDTLFVFQTLFITLLISAVLVYLQKAGFYSTQLLGLLTGVLLFANIAIIINRSMWTTKTRDKRYWNRRRFPTKSTGVAGKGPSACPTSLTSTESTPAAAPSSASGLTTSSASTTTTTTGNMGQAP